MTESRLSLKGEFLIAMPGLEDPNFSETVVCICEHTEEGSVGLVINREIPTLFAQMLFDELEIPTDRQFTGTPIHYGGPVHMNEVFVLHGPPFGWHGCLEITPSLAMSTTRDVLEAIANGTGPTAFRIMLGCSGWGPSQMESEISENVWLSCPVADEIIFNLPMEKRWEAAVKELGFDPLLLSDAAGHA